MPRLFAPSFVANVGGYFVAVDKVQPVAVLMSREAEPLSIVSWAKALPPPASSPWPNRLVGVGRNRLFVQDLPDGEVVGLSVASGELIIVEFTTASILTAEDIAVERARMFGAMRSDPVEIREGWRFISQLDRIFWSAAVEWHREGDVSTWPLGAGSIVSHAVIDNASAVSVRRAGKRPWIFEPIFEVQVLTVDPRGVLSAAKLPEIDISPRCWQRQADRSDVDRLLLDYMRYSVRQGQVVAGWGGRDVRVDLRQLDSDPVVEISFQLADVPGVRFRRIDKPVNELGHVAGGLRDLNITLVEDLESGLIDTLLESVPKERDEIFL